MQTKLKILFVAPYIPSHIRTRPYHFIKGLKKKGHSVAFIGLIDPYANKAITNELKILCDSVEIFKISKVQSYLTCLILLFAKIPLQAAYSFSKKMKKKIQRTVLQRDFDIMHVEHIRAGYLLPKTRNIPAVYDSVDCMTSLFNQFKKEKSSYTGRLIAFVESKKLEKSEPYILSQYDRSIVTASRDKCSLEDLSQNTKCIIPEIDIIENGVDCEYFRPEESSIEPCSIIFSGKIGYYSNELAAMHFAHDIFPLIKKEIQNAKFYIVGANPSKKVRQIGQHEDIIVTDWVPDIRKYLQFAHVVVCPVRVTVGIQNKFLEALAMAKAVVAYPEVVVPFQQGEKARFIVADNVNHFAKGVLQIINNEPFRLELQSNARNYVKKYYSWNEKINHLEVSYARAIAKYNNSAA